MPDEGCVDTEDLIDPKGASDAKGNGCIDYYRFPSRCGKYDDTDFISNVMCCACGGGTKGIISDILYDISYLALI